MVKNSWNVLRACCNATATACTKPWTKAGEHHPDELHGPHIRREFFEAQGTDAERAQTALTMIKILYLVEEKARLRGLDAEQRLELRLKESKPAFDTRGQWLQTEYDKVTPSSAIGKAIQYASTAGRTPLWFW